MVEFYDTHAHLDFPEFASDLDQVVARAEAAGITRLLTIGTTLASSRRAIELAERFPSVFAVVGAHPNHVLEEASDIVPELSRMAAHPKVVAIGETGLDYFRMAGKSAKEVAALQARQHDLFRQQLEVAAQAGLNCVIHQRDAFAETLAVLGPYRGRVRGVFHCFTGTPGEAEKVLETGGLVSFTGIATFKNAQTVRETLQSIPLERFMLETDCPFLAPVPYRGKRCEPAYVKELAEAVASVTSRSLEELSAATCATARAFFHRLS